MVVRRKRTGFEAEFMGCKGIGRAENEMKRNRDMISRIAHRLVDRSNGS